MSLILQVFVFFCPPSVYTGSCQNNTQTLKFKSYNKYIDEIRNKIIRYLQSFVYTNVKNNS